jgi:hypothetical protein
MFKEKHCGAFTNVQWEPMQVQCTKSILLKRAIPYTKLRKEIHNQLTRNYNFTITVKEVVIRGIYSNTCTGSTTRNAY